MKSLWIFGIIIISILLLVAYFIYKQKNKISVSNLSPDKIYKITPISKFDINNKSNCLELSDLDIKSGFIHASKGPQVLKILNRFFANETEVYLLELDQDKLKENSFDIRIEQNKKGGDYFPHIYSENKNFPLEVVEKIFKVEKEASQEWEEAKLIEIG